VQVDGLSASEVQEVIEDDSGVPDNLALQVSCIESGSIWMSMKSGSQSALKYLGSLFETGASARLAEQLANAQTAEANAQISEATRNDVAAQIRAEQEKLRVENIQQTYEVWRSELRSQLSFLDELIEHASDEAVVSKVKDLKNQAILQMADQQMVPIVRNVPGSFVSNDLDVLALPPPAT
jgi:multidrug efflux pump subunit AcrA (membrane-fusion protein)